jgi:hypothetical protein
MRIYFEAERRPRLVAALEDAVAECWHLRDITGVDEVALHDSVRHCHQGLEQKELRQFCTVLHVLPEENLNKRPKVSIIITIKMPKSRRRLPGRDPEEELVVVNSDQVSCMQVAVA